MNQNIKPTRATTSDLIAAMHGAARFSDPGGPQQTLSDSRPTKEQMRQGIQHILRKLLHAERCQQEQKSGKTSQCALLYCKNMRVLLDHMASCQAGKNCAVPRCFGYGRLLNHWHHCNKTECQICPPVKKAEAYRNIAQKNGAAALRHSLASSPDTKHVYATYEAFKNVYPTNVYIPYAPQPSPAPSLTNSQSVPGPMNPLFQQQLQHIADVIQHLQHMEAVSAIINVQPGNQLMATVDTKEWVDKWRQDMTADTRNYFVNKMVQAIAPTPDPTAMLQTSMSNVVAYARKVEAVIFKMATSRMEYCQLLYAKIYKMEKELEEKKQKSKKMSKI